MKTKETLDFSSTNGVISILEQVRHAESECLEKWHQNKTTLRRLEIIAFISGKINEAISEKSFSLASDLQEMYDFYSEREFIIQLSPDKDCYIWKHGFFENYLIRIYLLLVSFEKEPVIDANDEIQLTWEERDCPHLVSLVTLFKLDEIFCSWNRRPASSDDYIRLLQNHREIQELTFELVDFSSNLVLLHSKNFVPLLVIFSGWDHCPEAIKATYDLLCESVLEVMVSIKERNEPDAIVTVLYK